MLRPLSRTTWGLTVLGLALWTAGVVAPARAQTEPDEESGPIDVIVLLSCEEPGAVQGTADGTFGSHTFHLACDPASQNVDRTTIPDVENADVEPWEVRVTILGKACESSGSGLPALVSCAATESSAGAPVSFSIYSD